jgi:hypothetical protein
MRNYPVRQRLGIYKLTFWLDLRSVFMANEADNRTRIEAAISRSRRRWLASAMINAGGRWAVVPAGIVALAGIGLALAGATSLYVLLPLVALGVVGAGAALILTRRAYALPGAAGAPDWSLLLDRALGLNDALPAYIEGKGDFRAPLESRIAAALDATKEKQATPRRHYAPLAVALILALFPLVSWLPDPLADNDQASDVSRQPAASAPIEPSGGGSGKESATGTPDKSDEEETGDRSDSSGGGGDEGKVQKRPDGEKTGGGAGRPPEDVKPEPMKGNPSPKEGGTGDTPPPPTEAPKPEDKDVETDLTKIKPNAGEGETRIEDRSRLVYNPDGEPLDGSMPTPRDTGHAPERAMSRTKVTTGERKRIENVYRKLYE